VYLIPSSIQPGAVAGFGGLDLLPQLYNYPTPSAWFSLPIQRDSVHRATSGANAMETPHNLGGNYWGTLINPDKSPAPLLEQLCLGIAQLLVSQTMGFACQDIRS
jgi:hypothetical protein